MTKRARGPRVSQGDNDKPPASELNDRLFRRGRMRGGDGARTINSEKCALSASAETRLSIRCPLVFHPSSARREDNCTRNSAVVSLPRLIVNS